MHRKINKNDLVPEQMVFVVFLITNEQFSFRLFNIDDNFPKRKPIIEKS